jgi:hypothetical protein
MFQVAERSKKRDSIPDGGKYFSRLQNIQPHIQWIREALSLGVKRPGREADHSRQSSAEVTNELKYNSTASYAFMTCKRATVGYCHVTGVCIQFAGCHKWSLDSVRRCQEGVRFVDHVAHKNARKKVSFI